MSDTVSIGPRFNGPPGSANGGYACGVAAAFIDGTARVTLRRPPPLATELEVHHTNGCVELREGDQLVIEAEPATLEVAGPPVAVDLETADDATRRYPGFDRHPFPTCFTCGPRRPDDDGLRIYPGRVEGTDLYASPFVPDASVANAAGQVSPEVVWAALDCPSSFPFTGLGVVAVLGRLAARLDRPLVVGERYVAIGWPLGREGRKLHSASTITDGSGAPLAIAEATWVILRDQPAP
ncbi:MAG: hypothetical protein KY469_03895 [Actinobacteria bacterium]|nr:hypothetical protein [Actinomycetota bacterium]